MSAVLIGLHAGLVAVAFLTMLNGYLRGSAKRQVDAVLGVVWVGLLVVAFLVFGWKAGTAAVALSFAYGRMSRPLAASMARRLLGVGIGFEPEPRIKDLSIEGIMRTTEMDDHRLTRIAGRTEMAQVLAEYGKTKDDLKNCLASLMSVGMGDLAWEVISNPKDLKTYFALQERGMTPLDISLELRSR